MSINFKFNVSDIRNPIGILDSKINVVVSKTLDDSADLLIKEIRNTAPKKTGKYAKSWKKGTKSDNSIEITTPQARLFLMLEFTGAKPGIREGKLMVFRAKSGDLVFTMRVNWPGFQPIPHVRPALKRLQPQIIKIFYEHLKAEIPWFT